MNDCNARPFRFGARLAGAALVLASAVLLAGTVSAQTLRVGTEIPAQLDPAFASSDAEILILNAVYDYLIDVDAENRLQPRLATDWTVSDDGRTVTLDLAEDATFHDGTPVTAEDVVWTFDRLRDPEAELATSDLYANVEAVEASGEHEVTFTLAEADPFFLFDLSDNHALITPAGSEDLGSTFNGSGPFQVERYLPEDRVVLSANPEYHVEGKPGVEGVEIVFFADQGAAVSALRGGQIDLVVRMPTPLYQSLEDVPGIERHSVATNAFDLVRLRTDREPGDDPRVVEALKLAVDREQIVETVTDGLATLGNDTPVGPMYTQYHREDVRPPEGDVEEARALLAEAGYGDGLALTLHTPDTGDRPDLAVVLKEQLEEAGFEIDVQVQPESVYYGDGGWLEVDFGITGWGSRPVPQFYFDTMVACDAAWNEAHYCDERVDALIERAGSTLDEEERAEAYAELQRILANEGPYVIPYFFPQFAALAEGFRGLELKPFPGRSDLAAIRPE